MEYINVIVPVVTLLLGVLLGMRVEIRGVSGVAQDVKDAIDHIRTDIESLKNKIESGVQSVKADHAPES